MISDFVPVLLFSFSSSLTPGPNNFMLMNAGLHFGVKKSLGHYFGVCFGFPLMLLIVAVGFGTVFKHYPIIEHILKIVGSAYMLYLAYKILTSHSKVQNGKVHKPLSFFQAMLFQWVNPKAWLMGVSAMSIFILNSNPLINALILSLIFFLMCLPCLAVWLVFGKALQKILKEDHHRKWFNVMMALCLAGSVALIFLE